MLRVGRCQLVLFSEQTVATVKVLELNSKANLVAMKSYDLGIKE